MGILSQRPRRKRLRIVSKGNAIGSSLDMNTQGRTVSPIR